MGDHELKWMDEDTRQKCSSRIRKLLERYRAEEAQRITETAKLVQGWGQDWDRLAKAIEKGYRDDDAVSMKVRLVPPKSGYFHPYRHKRKLVIVDSLNQWPDPVAAKTALDLKGGVLTQKDLEEATARMLGSSNEDLKKAESEDDFLLPDLPDWSSDEEEEVTEDVNVQENPEAYQGEVRHCYLCSTPTDWYQNGVPLCPECAK